MVIAFSYEDTVRSEASVDEARVLDEDAMEAEDLREGEIVLAGLQDGAAPSVIEAVCYVTDTEDSETDFATIVPSLQQSTGRAMTP